MNNVQIFEGESNETLQSTSPVPEFYPLMEQHCGKAGVIFGVFTVRRPGGGGRMDPSAERQRLNIDPSVRRKNTEALRRVGLQVTGVTLLSILQGFVLRYRAKNV